MTHARRFTRVLESALVAVLWLLLFLGVTLVPLTSPAYTDALVRPGEVSARTGLSQPVARQMAQRVREFVAETDGRGLPSQVDGRPGFDDSMVSHLSDVRDVLTGARLATGALAAVLAVWVFTGIGLGRWCALRSGLRAGGALSLGLPAVVGLWGVLDFNGLFTVFHTLFFAAGTWTFPEDSLLIQLFPQRFWIASAVVWATLVMVSGAALLAASTRIPRETSA